MRKLSEPQLREFGIRGYVVIRDVIPPAILAAASRAIECLVDEQPPPEGHVGQHFYWLSSHDGGPLPALFYDTPLRSLRSRSSRRARSRSRSISYRWR